MQRMVYLVTMQKVPASMFVLGRGSRSRSRELRVRRWWRQAAESEAWT